MDIFGLTHAKVPFTHAKIQGRNLMFGFTHTKVLFPHAKIQGRNLVFAFTRTKVLFPQVMFPTNLINSIASQTTDTVITHYGSVVQ